MKLKMNKACDLNSISVLPPHARRRSSAPLTGAESSMFGNSQASAASASQLRSQSAASASQLRSQSFSLGASSQQGLFSQLSQNSIEDVLTNEQRLASQDMESSAKRVHCLPPVNHMRDESQMQITRSTSNLMRKWSPPEYKCQISEELQHRIGIMETSLSRVGMILDSVQKDIMQVNKGTKEVTMEIESLRQKIMNLDDLLQLTRKGQEDVKASFEGSMKSVFEQFKQNILQESNKEISMMLSAFPEKVETRILKSQNELMKTLNKELQAISSSLKDSIQKNTTPTVQQPKAISSSLENSIQRNPTPTVQHPKGINYHVLNQESKCPKSGPLPVQPRVASLPPKVEIGAWTSVNNKQAVPKERISDKKPSLKGVSPIPQERKCRAILESDDDINGGFSCLFSGKEKGDYDIEDVSQETERILKKARRRKRKDCNSNTIIIID